MFAQSLKRPRDEDLVLLDAKESKRLCPLWQPVPRARPESAADTDQSLRFRAHNLTPVDSSDDEAGFEKDGVSALDAGRLGKSKPAHGHRPPFLQLGADVDTAKHMRPVLASGDSLSPWLVGSQLSSHRSSPIPHQLVNQSLTINGVPTATPPNSYFPAEVSPLAGTGQPDLHMTMEDTAMKNVSLPPAIRLPSPISDNGDAFMRTTENTGDADAEMGDYSPASFTQTVSPAPSAGSADVYQQATPVVAGDHQTSTCTAAPRRRSPLVMGYRAGCTKCQCKAPGHYSHIRQP